MTSDKLSLRTPLDHIIYFEKLLGEKLENNYFNDGESEDGEERSKMNFHRFVPPLDNEEKFKPPYICISAPFDHETNDKDTYRELEISLRVFISSDEVEEGMAELININEIIKKTVQEDLRIQWKDISIETPDEQHLFPIFLSRTIVKLEVPSYSVNPWEVVK
ncbi:hypothetical protein [Ilyobacter polytropus]|uniref:Uncharacterized protein n=1 Tax=Ilyobacter polytropus (strain ATCC 51220 / DSM 2926 / LMG 16218 / CuHBu1) TaxID=572544 RepID=E3HBL8_ILYPC|nr:hypothetical protein [Ilyobacter polytropus]ADO83714.1 hypothetical protein Ilyop_1943 [Ilyobacter polytropus DSM 2926]